LLGLVDGVSHRSSRVLPEADKQMQSSKVVDDVYTAEEKCRKSAAWEVEIRIEDGSYCTRKLACKDTLWHAWR
jgi:hypothetical protein